MADLNKPRNPFLPGQPATVDLFVGRRAQIDHLLQRGVRQTALGKPTALFIEGEYGIGKSSLANYCLQAAEQEFGLLGVSASMAGQSELVGAAEAMLKALVPAAHRNKPLWLRVKDRLGRFVDSAELFGVSLKLIWPHLPRWVGAPLYIVLGWAAMVVLPDILRHGGPAIVVLMLVGGLVYSVGAVFYATRRPNPWPTVFGHHEFFHACTLIAAICHHIAIWFALYA